MYECTLQEAVMKCENEGGIFWMKNHDAPYKYSYDKKSDRFVDENGKDFVLEGADFENAWIYEPLKQSAFQKWHTPYYYKNEDPLDEKISRKEGWNAAIDKALEIAQKGDEPGILTFSLWAVISALEKLKEE